MEIKVLGVNLLAVRTSRGWLNIQVSKDYIEVDAPADGIDISTDRRKDYKLLSIIEDDFQKSVKIGILRAGVM